MSIKLKYSIKSIDSFQCKEWILKKHYAKRLPPIEFSFGLFENHVLSGIITFGTPNSSSLRSNFINHFKLCELNRLVINEGLENNVLSHFVSKSIKQLPKPLILISYADTAQNHNGYIYQATNWIYPGLSAKRTDWKIKGYEHLHGATIADKSRGKENRVEYLKNKYGDNFYLEDRSRKHRYFYFHGSKKDKKIMKNILPYKIEPYPKGKNQRYDASYIPKSQLNLF